MNYQKLQNDILKDFIKYPNYEDRGLRYIQGFAQYNGYICTLTKYAIYMIPKEKFLQGDYSKKVDSLKVIKEELRHKLIAVFSNNVLSYDLVSKLDYTFMRDIKYLVSDIDSFNNSIDKKSYASVEVANSNYNKIMGKYKELSKVLTDLI